MISHNSNSQNCASTSLMTIIIRRCDSQRRGRCLGGFDRTSPQLQRRHWARGCATEALEWCGSVCNHDRNTLSRYDIHTVFELVHIRFAWKSRAIDTTSRNDVLRHADNAMCASKRRVHQHSLDGALLHDSVIVASCSICGSLGAALAYQAFRTFVLLSLIAMASYCAHHQHARRGSTCQSPQFLVYLPLT